MFAKRRNTGKKIALSALIAGAAGYVTGLLTAPQSGKETRKDIVEGAENIRDDAEQQLEKVQKELKDLVKEAKTTSVKLSSKAKEEFNEAVLRAKDAQNKAATVLKAVRAGEAEDPELNRAVKQAKQAQKNLSKFLRG